MLPLRVVSRLVMQKVVNSRSNSQPLIVCGYFSNWYINNIPIRLKHTQHKGVKGLRGRKFEEIRNDNENSDENNVEFNLEDSEYDVVANSAMRITRICQDQKVLIIQPYIKWGSKKSETPPDLQLEEAEALIRSLPNWKVEQSLKVPLESMDKKTLFGTGKLQELKKLIQQFNSKGKLISCIFISKGTLSFFQKRFLEDEFGCPVMDRYSVVIQILRLHATSAEAKLQVAMAEIPYIWGQMKDANISTARKQGYYLNDLQKDMLKNRERKLKTQLESIRTHRKLLRNKRKQKNYPIVAVIGYTNAGKTSLIKALTKEETMQPRDQLFATLDVTAHAGLLPCNLEIIYMDTVGFMSDIPTGLIECFVATLEDAMMADLIIHIQDLAHANYAEQKRHVETTLRSLINTAKTTEDFKVPTIINVGNKIDLLTKSLTNLDDKLNLISSKTLIGIEDLLNKIESEILMATDRKKITIRVKSGGQEMAWLYKNSAVTNSRADSKDAQCILIDCVISDVAMKQFKHHFC